MKSEVLDKKYKEYIELLISQIVPLLPSDINKLQEDYLVNNLKHSCRLLALSMQTDSVFKTLAPDMQLTYIQIMAEWSFHKNIDLFRSGIPPKYWKVVMQKIWYTIWEVMYACIQNQAPLEVVLNVLERYVNRTYNDAIEELKETNLIDEQIEEQAKEQSNIEIMAQEYLSNIKKKKFRRRLYCIIMLIIVSVIVSAAVLVFKTYGVIGILTGLVIYNLFSKAKE